ncbi:Gfo/Idh/MocA family oxidoreductase [Cellulomonas sp. RIT-PI-Y]|uniref:Gfo/Idh/MocA family oxidoreductase n=1 Tax=Cellulomonas sp. RIT-PI-Y TaxID=3035297 RepID=UPI0021D965FA|nr:Gfo/Idh/MocA family oxidoreductase [Cellulomonas sp. RIT-PI-Y]
MRLAVIGLASSHVDQIVRLAMTGRLGPARIGALIPAEHEPVPVERVEALRRAAGHRGQDGYDVALVTTRDPATHRALAEPLLRAGVPVFVDKPFVADPADAAALVAVADRAGVPLTSSSALRWHPAVRAAARRWADGGDGSGRDPATPGRTAKHPADPATAGLTLGVSGPVDRGSPHGGRAFLGVHAVEAALGALALRGAGLDRSGRGPGAARVLRVVDDEHRRLVEVERGADRVSIDLGPWDGWHLVGPGVDADLPLADDYLRPGLLGFIEGVARGDRTGPLPGAALVEAAELLAEVCR